MAYIKLYRRRLKTNYNFLLKLFKKHKVEWGVVTKLLCGNELFLREVLKLGVKEVHDSRISNLKIIKKINPKIQTCYIKPPAKKSISNLIRYADVSLNTEFTTIKALSEEAKKQKKIHKIIIMVEMGDLREGVMGNKLVAFYGKIFKLKNINVIGIGTNFNCLHGVMPSKDKLIQLALYKKLIELQFKKKIPWISGGSTVSIPLLLKKELPEAINHLRIGEALFFGKNIFENNTIKGMRDNVLELYAEIIELTSKPLIPDGELAENPSGKKFEIKPEDYGKTSYRAILDVGLLDMNPDFLVTKDSSIEIVGASSDMLVVDLKDNYKSYKIGDTISFNLKYMGALSLLNSRYIDKIVI